MIFTTLLSLLTLALSTASTPVGPQQLVVVTPHITSPKAADVWTVGSIQNVTWETDNIPPGTRNFEGTLVLGFLTNYTDGRGHVAVSENLNNSSPLAQNFTIGTGHALVTVPNVPTRSNYIIVLFGDSGNASPQFKITRK
ncbi:hypothetical protein FB45DRAFT_1020792 [Roridomyces roridus]|uniref:Uncharacterized protein n=1 Tax=Roridomyces roridus TaxID=1738132 RepID=A0AAD7CAS8_9AGAR|nr:hypothetical protein FB45DRAFT_1020792 [Roridomyces roridus]